MTTVSVAQATRDFEGTLRRMTDEHEAVVVKRGRKAVAVMLPPDVLEEIEDLIDAREADRLLAEIESGREKVSPWEDVKARLGL